MIFFELVDKVVEEVDKLILVVEKIEEELVVV